MQLQGGRRVHENSVLLSGAREREPAQKSADETNEEGRVVIPGSYLASGGEWQSFLSYRPEAK